MKSPTSLVRLARYAPYNEGVKAAFKKESTSFLRSLAKKLQLQKGDYSIRFNPGGIAVSGDAILHHNSFYLTISGSGSYWRTCKGQKDYTGGQNRWVVGFDFEFTVEQLVHEIKTFGLEQRPTPFQSLEKEIGAF